MTDVGKYNGFNPITGQDYDPSRNRNKTTGRLWLPDRPVVPPQVAESKAAGAATRAGLRMERIGMEGLSAKQKGASVKDSFRS